MSLRKIGIRSIYIITIFALFATLAVGCGQQPADKASTEEKEAANVTSPTEEKKVEAAPTEAKPEKKELTPINLRLSWKYKGEYAHLFAAKELGYFEEEGLDVTILEGSEKATPMQLLVSGDDQFAYLDPGDLAPAIAAGMDLVNVGTFLQTMPVGIATHGDVPNSSPQDMIGKKVVDTAGSTWTLIMDPFLKANDIDPKKVEIIIADWGAKTTMFLEKDVDMVAGYVTNDFQILQVQQGLKLNYWLVADYGFNMLAHGIVTSREYAGKNPEITAGIVRAVQRGAKYAAENPEEAAKIMSKLFPEVLPEDVTIAQVKATVQLFHTPKTEGQPYGWASEEDWERTIALLFDNGGIESRLEKATDYFTNDYIDMSIK